MTYIIPGVIFGLSGGISPGPLLTLVISETLNHGIGAGIRVALAPLITDLPIVAVAVLVLSRLADVEPALGVVALAGAAFLAYLGVSSVRFRGSDLEQGEARPRSLSKGVVTNFVNPAPYIFWLTIGAPIVLAAWDRAAVTAMLFVFFFYLFLVGSKVVIAVAVGRTRRLLRSSGFVWLNRCLGLVLLVFSLMFLWNGLGYLGVHSG